MSNLKDWGRSRLWATMDRMPLMVRRRVEPVVELVELLRGVEHGGVLARFAPSVVRGFVLQLGRLASTDMVSGHAAHFDWGYQSDFAEMRELYERAKQNQWDASLDIDWGMDVDPMNPEVALLPDHFFDFEQLERWGVPLSVSERRRFKRDLMAWLLSQFLHGEQGALYAAAQVTESVKWVDGKLYGATQVMDEGRHVEAFHRYIDDKLGKLYVINDNLFTIIDALITDSRWDMKFLGMQIMVEGLALGAFATIYQGTSEPLLRQMLGYIIQDEARHVHYGVLALRDHIRDNLSEQERREREEWVFEVALLMRNRFLMYELHQEWFEHKVSRRQWREGVMEMPGLKQFRTVMFSRLVPNLRAIGLLSDRMIEHYQSAGLAQYMDGLDATHLSAEQILEDLDGPGTEHA